MFWAAVVAVLLLPFFAVGQTVDVSERDELELEFQRLVGAQDHRRQQHHLRHHHRAFLVAAEPAVTIPAAPPSEGLLMGRHPSVARKLVHMGQETQDLERRHQNAELSRHNLEDNVQKAVFHMNAAVGIKRELAKTDHLLHAEEIKLKRLEDDRLRLDRTHSHLVSSLHHIMEPKIQFAETRLKQRQRAAHGLQERAVEWKQKEATFHDSAIVKIEEREQAQLRVAAAREVVQKARLAEKLAKKQLEASKHDVAFNVQSYKYAQIRARASVSKEARGEEVVREAEFSVKRLSGILNMEQRRVDESMAVGKDRVQGKIRELEGVKEKSKAKAAKLSEEYGAWQRRQRSWASRVAANKQITDEASKDYAAHQRAILDDAQSKVANDAESDSDWAWDSDFSKGDDMDEVHLGAN